MPAPAISDASAAAHVARALKAHGVARVFGLCGGHIMPLWMRIDGEGIEIVGVRDERAAVHMAQAHAEVTGGLGVALVTAGPGVTNAMTGIANADMSRTPVLILSGCPPTAQEGRGALQDMDHARLVAPVARYARTVRDPSLAPAALAEAIACALGEGGAPGPAFLDMPTDMSRAEIPAAMAQMPRQRRQRALPDPACVAEAVGLLWAAERPLVISGRGARRAGPTLAALLDRLGAVHLDTGESRGLVADDHPSTVASLRGRVMGEADLVVTVGRRLDFQLGYGSPAIFPKARFVRIADIPGELRDNRQGDAAILADCGAALEAILAAAGNREPACDRGWRDGLHAEHLARTERHAAAMAAAPDGADGRMHPNRLIAALRDGLPPDAIVVVDGGDFLAFARVGLSAPTMLDPGPFGCIGVGVPYGVAAALACPGRPVLVATGDGAFGFNAMELDTAARHGAKAVFVVANNGAWQIEVHDQREGYGRVVGTRLADADHAAMARGLGLHAERVERADDLPAAIVRAFANAPALIDVAVTTDAVSSDGRAGLAWVPDLQPLAAWDEAERAWRAGR